MERRKFVAGAGAAAAGIFMVKPGSSLPVYDVREFGARGDGKSSDTYAIQAAVDRCYEKGGGKVYLGNGCFVSGTIYLKSNVTLYLESGAVLKGSDNLGDFLVIPSKYPSYTGTHVTNRMLIYAEDQQNITISGRGTIDGNGDHWAEGPYGSPSFSVRPRIIHFRGCENIHVRDVTLYNSASWVQSYQSCKNLLIDGITVNSRENPDIEKPRYARVKGRNTDGLDLVDCRQARISNCFINSGDDAICLKSFSHDEACRDITITNCVVSSNASGIKIGTESAGAFEDINILNCVVYDTRADGIALLTADGARVERITVSNITMRNVKGAAIAIRLGIRNRTYREDAVINVPALKDVMIGNIQGTRISGEFGCSIRGIKDKMVENIVLQNINLQFEGGVEASASYREIPEDERGYPSGRNFGVVPAYGFYIRHAKNIYLDKVRLGYIKEDRRPAIICDNVEQLEIKGLKAQGTLNTPELIRLVNSRDVVISGSRPASPVPVFLNVQGERSKEVILRDNVLRDAKKSVSPENPEIKKIVTETRTIN